MTNLVHKELTGIETLVSTLSAILDEGHFHLELSKFISRHVKSEKVEVISISDDKAEIIISNHRVLAHKRAISLEHGAISHVVKSKRPYFSNNTAADPLLKDSHHEGILAEMLVPVVSEGSVIAVIRMSCVKEMTEFTRDNLTDIGHILNHVIVPVNNLRMFMAAKALNETLLRRLEDHAKDQHSGAVASTASKFKIKEPTLIGRSDIMKEVVGIADRAANSHHPIMIHGEIGTGREVLARRIHSKSERKDKAFIVINCSSFENGQLEKELFGIEQHSTIGKSVVRSGLLEQANGGTIVLKEIEAITSVSLQHRLLSFIKDGVITRLGGAHSMSIDLRLIAITHDMNLVKLMPELADLLSTINIRVPALHERGSDIEILANYFMNLGKEQQDHKTFAPSALTSIMSHHFHNNIRGLMSAMEQARTHADGMIIENHHLPKELHLVVEEVVEEVNHTNEQTTNDGILMATVGELTLEAMEKKFICMTLENLAGNKTKTAKALGITVKTLYNKLHIYGMVPARE